MCVVYAALAAFFAWGMSTPDLDRVWTLHHELKSGRIGAPSADDREVLIRSMERHPELAGALLREGEIGLISSNMEGWIAGSEATVVRTRKADPSTLQLEIASPDTLLPLSIEVEGRGFREHKELPARGVHSVALPPVKGAADLIVVRLLGRAAHADPSVLGVRIFFGDPARAGL